MINDSLQEEIFNLLQTHCYPRFVQYVNKARTEQNSNNTINKKSESKKSNMRRTFSSVPRYIMCDVVCCVVSLCDIYTNFLINYCYHWSIHQCSTHHSSIVVVVVVVVVDDEDDDDVAAVVVVVNVNWMCTTVQISNLQSNRMRYQRNTTATQSTPIQSTHKYD